MKKNLMFILMALFAIAFTSCDPKEPEQVKPTIQWNLTADAEGEGLVEIGFPMGSIKADGIAEIVFKTSSDSLNLRSVNMLNCEDVLSNPVEYSEDQLQAASEVQNSVIYVKELEGTWNVDIVGYAKYGTLYFLIDEHFPKDVDTIDEVIEADSI